MLLGPDDLHFILVERLVLVGVRFDHLHEEVTIANVVSADFSTVFERDDGVTCESSDLVDVVRLYDRVTGTASAFIVALPWEVEWTPFLRQPVNP